MSTLIFLFHSPYMTLVTLKVPKCEILDRSDFYDFYTIKSVWEGDFWVKQIFFNKYSIQGSFRAAKLLTRMLSLILWRDFLSLGKLLFSWSFWDHALTFMPTLSIRVGSAVLQTCWTYASGTDAYPEHKVQEPMHALSVRGRNWCARSACASEIKWCPAPPPPPK